MGIPIRQRVHRSFDEMGDLDIHRHVFTESMRAGSKTIHGPSESLFGYGSRIQSWATTDVRLFECHPAIKHGNGKWTIYQWCSHWHLHVYGIFQPAMFDETRGYISTWYNHPMIGGSIFSRSSGLIKPRCHVGLSGGLVQSTTLRPSGAWSIQPSPSFVQQPLTMRSSGGHCACLSESSGSWHIAIGFMMIFWGDYSPKRLVKCRLLMCDHSGCLRNPWGDLPCTLSYSNYTFKYTYLL